MLRTNMVFVGATKIVHDTNWGVLLIVVPVQGGGLAPVYPMIECVNWGASGFVGDIYVGEVYLEGCHPLMSLQSVYYAIFRAGQLELITTTAKLQTLYAPIGSADEALSYAKAVTGLKAQYSFPRLQQVRYLVDRVEATHVRVQDGEYIVNLYEYDGCGCGCGCGYHRTYMVNVHVTTMGVVYKQRCAAIYEDRVEICRD